MNKQRLAYTLLFFITIPIGLLTRKKPNWFLPFIAKYGGDVLWAALFFFLFRWFFINKPLWKIALYTYFFAVCIEVSELYHAPWIDDIRRTFLGKMILGFGFLWSDIICYAVGVLLAWVVATFVDKLASYK